MKRLFAVVVALAVGTSGTPARGQAPEPEAVGSSPLADALQTRNPEVSTEEMRALVERGDAVVIDARPALEFAVGHIPGALNVAERPGVPQSSAIAGIEGLLQGDKSKPLVIYCNGPFGSRSARLAAELIAAGYTDVRRYQLGIPVWRALGGLTEIEPAGLREVLSRDPGTVVIDVRDPADFQEGSLARSRNIPRGLVVGNDAGEVRRAREDGRLPVNDHSTRIIVVGRNADQAEFVARALTREAFHNVAYFAGTLEEARAALR